MDGSLSNGTPLNAIMYMIYHIFLPPELPQEDDFDPQYEKIMLDTTSDALQMFKAAAENGQHDIIESVRAMIGNLRNLRDDLGTINEGKFESALRELPKRGMFPPLVT